jgi:hypothetical protein
VSELTDRIARLPKDWHRAGSVANAVLDAIERHCRRFHPLTYSVETGCGKSTLLLSHLSQHHVVFTLGDPENDDSHLKVLGSPLLNTQTVEWVYGPTQRALPVYRFTKAIQLALIDGPHGYPFPQMEYWALYPFLSAGALLIVDDIQIPTIYQLFLFLKATQCSRFSRSSGPRHFLVELRCLSSTRSRTAGGCRATTPSAIRSWTGPLTSVRR